MGLYRLPSGRLAEIVHSIPGCSHITFRYLDDGEEVTLSKKWVATAVTVIA
jgi:hypothetical protein